MSDNQNLNGGHPPTQHPGGMAAIFLTLMGVKPLEGGEVPGGATRVLSGYSSAYILPISDDGREFCLIDTGADPNAEELLAVLRYKGVDAAAVKAIFVTHGHTDHTSGLHKFSEAEVYVGAGDHDFVEGTGTQDGPMLRFVGKKPELAVPDKNKLHDLTDGQSITVGNRQILAFAVPGHTRGSFAFLTGGMLFVGDALTFGKHGEGQKPPLPVSYSVSEGVRSLADLVKHFDDNQLQVETVLPSHSGSGTFDALRQLAA